MKVNKLFYLLILSIFLFIGCDNSSDFSINKDTDSPPITKSSDEDRTYGNSINNYQPPIYLAEYDNNFYYCNSELPGIFKLNPQTSKWNKLSDDKGSYLNIYKDELYYINSTGDIVKMDLDGKSNRKLVALSASSFLIQNDILLYSKDTPHENKDGFSDFSLVQVDLKTNEIISDEIKSSRSFHFADENRYICGSRELFNYISINDELVYPRDNKEHIITLIGATKDLLISKVNDFSDNTSFLSVTNNGSINTLDLPINSAYLVADNKIFYSNSTGVSYINLATNEKVLLHKHPMVKDSNLFEFNNIIYSYTKDALEPMYDISKNTLLGKYSTPPKEEPPKVEKPVNEVDLAKNLILAADKTNIKTENLYGFKLSYIDGLSSKDCINLAKSWNINLKGNCYSFELSGDYMINQYIVEIDTKKVYYIPNQGMMPAYLMDKDKKIQKFNYKNS